MNPLRTFLSALVILLSFSVVLSQDGSCACCSDDHKAFDFWVGSWEVTGPSGSKVGENRIEKIEDGCVLKESWTSANGVTTGTSINFYNSKLKQWEQLWVDNSGSVLKLRGRHVENQMILSSQPFVHSDGGSYVNRITWTHNKDGTVRQLWELVQDQKVAKTLFDGLYKKME